MPYITQKERDALDPIIDKIPELNDGQLNYTITRICHHFLKRLGLRYMNLVRVLGGLICVMFELYRCIAAPYEDKKKRENGNISDLDKTIATVDDVVKYLEYKDYTPPDEVLPFSEWLYMNTINSQNKPV